MASSERSGARVAGWTYGAGIIAAIVAAAAILLAMGRNPICTCGDIELWHGTVQSAGNSQHLSDWYSFSHLTHGFIFYGLGWWLLRTRPFSTRLLLATLVEAGWEILENTPMIIDRYRETTMAFGYSGDSVLNSVSDIAMMIAGSGWQAACDGHGSSRWRWRSRRSRSGESATI